MTVLHVLDNWQLLFNNPYISNVAVLSQFGNNLICYENVILLFFIARRISSQTITRNHISCSENALKLTYSNVEFKNVLGLN